MSLRAAARRRSRELRTVEAMIAIHCHGNHGTSRGLCESCQELWRYTRRRVDRCLFGGDKPTCLTCTVHCFRPGQRDRIREVMRYAGPRMLLRHPLLSLHHFRDGRRATPPRPRRAAHRRRRGGAGTRRAASPGE